MFRHFHNSIANILTGFSANTLVVLTETGKRVVYSMSEGGINYHIGCILEENGGSMRASTLASKAGINFDELKNRLMQLKSAGYVQFNLQNEGSANSFNA